MKNILILSLLFALPYGVPSCDELLKTVNTMAPQGAGPLSGSEIVDGLKTALRVGTDSSVAITSRPDGFYKDEAIKILLPPEARVIYENKDNVLFRATGIDQKIEDAIMAINRAAEDAATEAGPIFKDAILSLSITEGLTILKGKNPAAQQAVEGFDSTAATSYLRSTTYLQLRDAFSPKISTSLDKKLVGNYSPNQIYNTLTTSYNTVANRSFGVITPLRNTDLSVYVTERALDGIFLKVAQEEIKIRKDPFQWAKTAVGNILQRVFGAQNP
jgi:hypothetical protein